MKKLGSKFLLVLIIVLLIPYLIIAALIYFSYSLFLSIATWATWGLRGRYVLFVTSDSPIWSSYIEQQILPHIKEFSVVINWSGRKQWKISLAVLAFKLYGGSENFNPLAIVFRPFRIHKTFRFYKAFKDFKHGKTETLEKIRLDFFKEIQR